MNQLSRNNYEEFASYEEAIKHTQSINTKWHINELENSWAVVDLTWLYNSSEFQYTVEEVNGLMGQLKEFNLATTRVIVELE